VQQERDGSWSDPNSPRRVAYQVREENRNGQLPEGYAGAALDLRAIEELQRQRREDEPLKLVRGRMGWSTRAETMSGRDEEPFRVRFYTAALARVGGPA
jgi:hypothetical protein